MGEDLRGDYVNPESVLPEETIDGNHVLSGISYRANRKHRMRWVVFQRQLTISFSCQIVLELGT